jgi:hypothetical protein
MYRQPLERMRPIGRPLKRRYKYKHSRKHVKWKAALEQYERAERRALVHESRASKKRRP